MNKILFFLYAAFALAACSAVVLENRYDDTLKHRFLALTFWDSFSVDIKKKHPANNVLIYKTHATVSINGDQAQSFKAQINKVLFELNRIIPVTAHWGYDPNADVILFVDAVEHEPFSYIIKRANRDNTITCNLSAPYGHVCLIC